MKLLVSVRSRVEALAALAGGADLIDVKEPLRGALGRADDAVVADIVNAVDGRLPVSGAMGELTDVAGTKPPSCQLAFIKFGLAGCLGRPWGEQLIERRRSASSTVVPTAYADAGHAQSPPVEDVAAFAMSNGFPVLLVDTFGKGSHDLFDWMAQKKLAELVQRLQNAGVAVALAGSITNKHLPAVRRIDPTWLAVRGAVCTAGERNGIVDMKRVRALKTMLCDGYR